MGCFGSKGVPPAADPRDISVDVGRAGAPKKRSPPKIDPNAPFELSTPMLVMLFDTFKQQGRIEKNVVAWRQKAFESKWLIEYSPELIVIFVSQRWCAATPPPALAPPAASTGALTPCPVGRGAGGGTRLAGPRASTTGALLTSRRVRRRI